MKKEFLFRALGDVGDDLLHMAEHRRFSSPWKKWVSLAACLALIVSLGALALPYFPMGCGASQAESSTESAAPMETPEMEAESADLEEAIEEEAPAEAEPPAGETAPDDAGAEHETADDQQGKVWLTVCDTFYYLLDGVTAEGQKPGDVGEYLAEITDSNDESLIGCPVYAVMDTTWYSKYAVNGQSVPAEIYIEAPDGWLCARTNNEKTVARHTAAEVQSAIDSGDTVWIIDALVRPVQAQQIELLDGGRVADSETLNRLFLASLQLNVGTTMDWVWMQEDGTLLVSPADVEQRLSRFLDTFTYEPETTAAWDSKTGMLHFGSEELFRAAGDLTLKRASVSGDRVWLWVLEAGVETCYELRFDEDCWRYMNIEVAEGEATYESESPAEEP